MESAEALKRTEQDTLNKVESSYEESTAGFRAFCNDYGARLNYATSLARDMALFGTVSPSQVAAANQDNLQKLQQQCDQSAQWQNYFLGFEATARTLGEAGLPKLAIRLREISADIAGALKALQEMCLSAQQSMQANAAVWNNALQYTANVIQQVVNRQKQVFDTFRVRWDNEMFNKCPRCGSLLESRTLPYCWHCNALVVRF